MLAVGRGCVPAYARVCAAPPCIGSMMMQMRDTHTRCYNTKYTNNVYFIAEIPFNGNVKIGRSKNIPRRRRQLQSGNPNKLVVLCHIPTNNAPALEKQLHRKFAEYHIRGEWYCLSIPQVRNEYCSQMKRK